MRTPRRTSWSTLALLLLYGLFGAASGARSQSSVGLPVDPPPEPRAGEPGWRRLELPASGSYAWRYVPIGLAGGGADSSLPDGYPAILFLHGSGASPELWRPFLEGPAEAAGAVVLAPAPSDPFGWGIADDAATLEEAVDRLAEELSVDRARVSLAGHSAGGAYAYFLAYETRGRYSGVFSFSAPFRFILGVADPGYTPPLRLWYGREDPNFLGGHLSAIAAMVEHRGIPWQAEVVPGLGHNDIRQEDLEAGFTFLVDQSRPRENRLTAKGAAARR